MVWNFSMVYDSFVSNSVGIHRSQKKGSHRTPDVGNKFSLVLDTNRVGDNGIIDHTKIPYHNMLV